MEEGGRGRERERGEDGGRYGERERRIRLLRRRYARQATASPEIRVAEVRPSKPIVVRVVGDIGPIHRDDNLVAGRSPTSQIAAAPPAAARGKQRRGLRAAAVETFPGIGRPSGRTGRKRYLRRLAPVAATIAHDERRLMASDLKTRTDEPDLAEIRIRMRAAAL